MQMLSVAVIVAQNCDLRTFRSRCLSGSFRRAFHCFIGCLRETHLSQHFQSLHVAVINTLKSFVKSFHRPGAHIHKNSACL